ncbi:hypothetical protein [uncultured Polaribacter sp.]|uniref:hypothetical protein n=1 Tax=uncultured Polaribacter sp. TaxID=174711 RepID=UPI002630AC46|nr:hypothetical protein [uncultured Polaribacter sp.]
MKQITLLFTLLIFTQLLSQEKEGVFYKMLTKDFSKNSVCHRCNGKGTKHSSGNISTEKHEFCKGNGCSDCNYKGVKTYKGKPYDYKCGGCNGNGKNALVNELHNLDNYTKIKLIDHLPYIALYNSKEDGYIQPRYEFDYEYGLVKYLIYNENTKRVFDQWGNPLFDIGYKDNESNGPSIIDFIYCGAYEFYDSLQKDLYENPSFNRKISDPIFVCGTDYTNKHGAKGDFNISTRYSWKIKQPEFPLVVNAVSKVSKVSNLDKINIERMIVMMYVTLLSNQSWFGVKIFNDQLNNSYETLKSNFK